MLYSSMFGTMMATQVPGAVYMNQSLTFKTPVFVGDSVTARIEVVDVTARRVMCKTTILNDVTGELAVDGEATILIPKQ